MCDETIDIILHEQAMALLQGKRRSMNQIIAKIVREWKSMKTESSLTNT